MLKGEGKEGVRKKEKIRRKQREKEQQAAYFCGQ